MPDEELTSREKWGLASMLGMMLGGCIMLVWLAVGAFTDVSNPVLIRVASGAVRLTGWGWLLLFWLCVVAV